jgi:hypothetical protein
MHLSHCPSCKIQTSETLSQFTYTLVDSKESGAPLPLLRVCYAGRVVWCQWVTAEREHDVINLKSPEECVYRVGSLGSLVLMVIGLHLTHTRGSYVISEISETGEISSVFMYCEDGKTQGQDKCDVSHDILEKLFTIQKRWGRRFWKLIRVGSLPLLEITTSGVLLLTSPPVLYRLHFS